MIIRVNVTSTKPGLGEGFLEIKNLNNVSMNVDLNVTNKIIKLSQPSITLLPNETTLVNFTVETTKVGNFEEKILATYSVEHATPVQLYSEVTIIATGEDTKNLIDKKIFILFGVAILVFVPLILFLRRRP